MLRKRVAIIDYGMGNLFSVKQALECAGWTGMVTSDPGTMMDCDAAVLPGVGAFKDAMTSLMARDLVPALKRFIATGRPFIGVCLGMQLLMSSSDEFGRHAGLDIIKGRVVRLPDTVSGRRIRVPHIGWNRITNASSGQKERWAASPLSGLADGEYMYFVHSYYCVPDDETSIASVSTYEGVTFCSSFIRNNVFGCQFHPEKSGSSGLRIYRNLFADKMFCQEKAILR